MKTITIEVNKKDFKYPEYVYKIPVYQSVSLKDFYNKSLDEIENQYGKKVAINVYKCACNGKDLTKELPPAPKTKEVIDLRLINHDYNISVYIIANEYNQSNKDTFVCGWNNNQKLTKDMEKYFFSVVIDYLIKGENNERRKL